MTLTMPLHTEHKLLSFSIGDHSLMCKPRAFYDSYATGMCHARDRMMPPCTLSLQVLMLEIYLHQAGFLFASHKHQFCFTGAKKRFVGYRAAHKPSKTSKKNQAWPSHGRNNVHDHADSFSSKEARAAAARHRPDTLDNSHHRSLPLHTGFCMVPASGGSLASSSKSGVARL